MRACVAADEADTCFVGASYVDSLTVASKIIADIACDWRVITNGQILFECPESTAAVQERLKTPSAATQRRIERKRAIAAAIAEWKSSQLTPGAKSKRSLVAFDTNARQSLTPATSTTPPIQTARSRKTQVASIMKGSIAAQKSVESNNKGLKTYMNGPMPIRYVPRETPEGYVKYADLATTQDYPCPSMMLNFHRKLKPLLSIPAVEKAYKMYFAWIFRVCCDGLNDFKDNILVPTHMWAHPTTRAIIVTCADKGKDGSQSPPNSFPPCDELSAMFNPVFYPERHFLGKDVSRPFKMIYPADTRARDNLIELLGQPTKDLNKEYNGSNFGEIITRAKAAAALCNNFADSLKAREELWLPESAEDMAKFIDENIEAFILTAQAYFEKIRKILNPVVGSSLEDKPVDSSLPEMDEITSALDPAKITDDLKLVPDYPKKQLHWAWEKPSDA